VVPAGQPQLGLVEPELDEDEALDEDEVLDEDEELDDDDGLAFATLMTELAPPLLFTQ
jgi:hypothetical protein